MRTLIIPPLIINFMMFIIGIVTGVNPALITISAPGGYVFQIDTNFLIFSLVAICIFVGSIVGIRILGSGISDTSVTIINRCNVYFTTWSVLSTITFSSLSLVPTPFGAIIYTTLTVMYAFGVFLSLGDIGGGGGVSGGGGEKAGSDES